MMMMMMEEKQETTVTMDSASSSLTCPMGNVDDEVGSNPHNRDVGQATTQSHSSRTTTLAQRLRRRSLGANRSSSKNSHTSGGPQHPLQEQQRQGDMTWTSSNPVWRAPTKEGSGWNPLNLRSKWLAMFILAVGAVCAGTLIYAGVKGARKDEQVRFEAQGAEIVSAVQNAWKSYDMAGLWVHQSLMHKRDYSSFDTSDRHDFKAVYDHLVASGLQFRTIAYAPNITHANRAGIEQESAAYYQRELPNLDYMGFTNLTLPYGFERQKDKAYYFPLVLTQPLQGNEALVDHDIDQAWTRDLITTAFAEYKVMISIPLPMGPPSEGPSFFVMNPGVPHMEHKPNRMNFGGKEERGVAIVRLSFADLLSQVTVGLHESLSVYFFDFDESHSDAVIGAARLEATETGIVQPMIVPFQNVTMEALRQSAGGDQRVFERQINVGQRTWGIVIVADQGTFQPNATQAIVGGALMFAASAFCVAWYISATKRQAKIDRMHQKTAAEKADLIIKSAQETARAERRLNEYLSHEVRNPLSAALSACSFLEAEQEKMLPFNSVQGPELEKASENMREDLGIIKHSLEFIYDLLRSILDISKIENKQLHLAPAPTDLLKDILEPVKTIVQSRAGQVRVILDCPPDTVMDVDRMRLKQVVLNLAMNSRKFVQKGFIRLKVQVLAECVQLSVEDSGPGVPPEKRANIFGRFQESLDLLAQGTGMGLSLCLGLVDLMEGRLFLDESFNSGVEGCPGTRFVVELPGMPISPEGPVQKRQAQDTLGASLADMENSTVCSATCHSERLPEVIKVLIVDDDRIIRKMIIRSLKRIVPKWKITEAANGETALDLVAVSDFDLILMDQYMASVEKQLLGTETVQAMRARGVTTRICGLSANDIKTNFLEAGADHFLLKPFSTNRDDLEQDMADALG